MLKNIMKDLEKYARWQVFFFSYACVISVTGRAKNVRGWLSGIWKGKRKGNDEKGEWMGKYHQSVLYAWMETSK